MILDDLLVFSDAQAITVTAASTDILDTLAPGNHAPGKVVVIQVHTTLTAGGSATLDAALETDDNSAFTSPTVLARTGVIAVAALVAEYKTQLTIPPGAQRYLRVNYTVATGPMTAGKVDAFIPADVDMQLA